MKKIAIYAGHGGSDSGACYNNRREKDYTLNVLKSVTAILKDAGHIVINNRTTDINRNLTTDGNRTNKEAVDAVIEIHLNANTGTPGTGVETFYSVTGRGKELATAIQNKIVALGFRDRGIKTQKNNNGDDYFAIVRIPQMPAVLVETAFINNDSDMAQYDINKMGQAIAEGILSIYPSHQTINNDDSENILDSETAISSSKSEPVVGDIVIFKGSIHYRSSNTISGTSCKSGKALVTKIAPNTLHPYHLIKEVGGEATVYGWVNRQDIEMIS